MVLLTSHLLSSPSVLVSICLCLPGGCEWHHDDPRDGAPDGHDDDPHDHVPDDDDRVSGNRAVSPSSLRQPGVMIIIPMGIYRWLRTFNDRFLAAFAIN